MRGFERIRADSSDTRTAYDTRASATCEGKYSRRDKRYNSRRQDDVPAAVDGAWHTASPCQMLVCGVHVLDGYETLHDEFEENAHTEARYTRCKVPDGDVVLLQQKHPCPTTVYAAHVPSGFLYLDDRKGDDIKLSPPKTKHSIAVGLWARPTVLLTALSQASHPSLCTSTRAVARPQKTSLSTVALSAQ